MKEIEHKDSFLLIYNYPLLKLPEGRVCVNNKKAR